MKKLIAILVPFFLAAASVRAQERARLSDRGRVMVSGSLGGSFWADPEPAATPRSGVARWAVQLQPSVVYFLRDRVGLGAYGGYGVTRGRFVGAYEYFDQNVSTGIVGVFEAVVSGRFGLFALPYVGYSHRWREMEIAQGAETGPLPSGGMRTARQWDDRLQLGIRLPLVVHVSDSVALGVGPDFLLEFIFYRGSTLPTTFSNPDVAPQGGGRHERREFNGLRIGVDTWIACSF